MSEAAAPFDGHAAIINCIKQETWERSLRDRPLMIIAENADGTFTVHRWSQTSVFPTHDYPDARKAVSRVLQLLGLGPVAPQTHPEETCIGHVAVDGEAS